MPHWPHARIAIAVVMFGLAALGFMPKLTSRSRPGHACTSLDLSPLGMAPGGLFLRNSTSATDGPSSALS